MTSSERGISAWIAEHASKYLIVLLLILPQFAMATTIAQVGSNELIARAQIIFHGVVTGRQAKLAQNGHIRTFVDFQVLDQIKGPPIAGELTLRFFGGEVDGRRIEVGSQIPALGEEGIYFVESIDRPLLNPLLGWSQGHYIISEEKTVESTRGDIVISVEAVSKSSNLRISSGVARGIAVRKPHEARKGLTAKEFKSKVRSLMSAGRR